MTAFLALGVLAKQAGRSFKELAMSSQFAGRLWNWVVPAGIIVGLMGLWAPAQADDEKVEVRVIKKDGDEERKDEERKEVKREDRKEEGRKEEGRKEEGRKEEPVKKGDGQGHNDARIDELARFVKQLAGQVNELREEVRGLRSGGFGPAVNPEEYRKRMEEMAKKFGAANPAGISPEKMKEEFERRFKADKEKFAREAGGDAENQIRREIEKLQVELKRITAIREGGDKKEPKKDVERKEGGDKKEDGERKEGGDKKEVKERDSKEDKEEDKKEDKKEDDK
jgi:hypothetical protein